MAQSSFGISNIVSLVFVLIGILLFLTLNNFNLPINLDGAQTVLQYGAALGSILGGLSMLFKKKEIVQTSYDGWFLVVSLGVIRQLTFDLEILEATFFGQFELK